MSKHRFSSIAVVRQTDHTGRAEVVRSTSAGTVVRTEYPAHSDGSYLRVYDRHYNCEQVWESARLRGQPSACRAVIVSGDDFAAWLAGYVGGSLVTEAADWDGAVAGVEARAARIAEQLRPLRELEERMREEDDRLERESDAREAAMGWGRYEDAYVD